MADDIDRRLQEELHVVDLDNQYTVEEILREGATGRTERVHAPDGTILIRKYLKRGATQGNEYALLLGLQGAPFPRIIVLYELADWQVVIMEYLDGPTLQKCVEMQGPFPPDQAVLLALGVCHAAQVLHTSGPNLIIHRDIKPDNIILQNGYVKLIDFGIARQFKAGEDHDTEYLGTRGYAAPEQFGYSQTDARTDIYAIGATLYFLLTGERFEAQRRTALASMSWIPADLARIIYRCTEFSPEARYQTAGELMGELQKARVTASVTATPQALPTAVLPAPAKAAKRGVTDRAGQFRDTKTFRVLRVIWVVAVNIVFWPFFLIGMLQPFTTDFWIFQQFGLGAFVLDVVATWCYVILFIAVSYLVLANPFKILDRIKLFTRNPILKAVLILCTAFVLAVLVATVTEALQPSALKIERTHHATTQQSQQTTHP